MTTYAGWQIDTYFKSGSGNFVKLDGIQRVTHKLAQGTEVKEECGTRYAAAVIEGIYQSTLSIERFYTGSAPWIWIMKGEAQLDYCDLMIFPNKSGSGKPYIQIAGLKLDNYSTAYRPAANLMTETYDFLGTGSVTNGTAG